MSVISSFPPLDFLIQIKLFTLYYYVLQVFVGDLLNASGIFLDSQIPVL